MALDDYVEPEVGLAVAVTAAVCSPPVRRALRRGAVYGVAAIMMAGEALGALARGVERGARAATASPSPPLQDIFDHTRAGRAAAGTPER